MPVSPDPVSPPKDVHPRGRTGSFDLLVAEERGDLAQVVVDDEESDQDLRGGYPADAAATSSLDVFVTGCFQLLISGLDGITGVVMEGLPLFAAEAERLLRCMHLGQGEGGRVLLADGVYGLFLESFRLDLRTSLPRCGQHHFAQGTELSAEGLGVAVFTHYNDMLASLSDAVKAEGIEHEIAGLSDALAAALDA